MDILVTLIVGLIIIAGLVYGEGYLSPPLDAGLVRLIQALTIILGIVLIGHRAGVL